MEGHHAFSEDYYRCVAAEKLRDGARRVVVADRDGCIQPFPHPVPAHMIPSTELTAGKEIRKMTDDGCVFVESSAQVIELATDADAYTVSAQKYGLKRSRPNITLPDGIVTSNPADVPEWVHLHNPDAFLGFGSGVYLRSNGGYATDWELHKALGGYEWRPKFFEDLAELERRHPEIDFDECLGKMDKKRLKRNPESDVDPLEFRVQFDQLDPERRAQLLLALMTGKGWGFRDSEFVDESNPKKPRFTTYAVAEFAQKHLVLERFGSGLSLASQVPMEELTFDKVGDSPTDLLSGLIAFQGAKEVNLIIAGNSRLSHCIAGNECSFAGMPLPGSPDHPLVPGRYHPTDMPGVFLWKGVHQSRPRRVVVADHTPFAEGLWCTESVLVCLKYLWYGPSLRRS